MATSIRPSPPAAHQAPPGKLRQEPFWRARGFRTLAIILVVLFAIWYFLKPNETWLAVAGSILLVLLNIAFAIVFALVQFIAIFWFLGRSRIYWVMPGETGLTFKDYKGNPEVLEVAARIVTLLRGVKGFKEMGGEVTRGVLLVGGPGTGKSYLAQVIANESGLPFGYASAASMQSMFFGIGNIKVMGLYRKARRFSKRYGACIIFLDELDAIGASRANQGPSTGIMGGMFGGGSGLLNELLMQMDPPPVDQTRWGRFLRMLRLRRGRRYVNPPVLTMAATNIPDVLDAALLRPGRFDKRISVHAPSAGGRKEVIQYYLDKVKHDAVIDVDEMVSDSIHFTPAAIKMVVNDAVVVSHFKGKSRVEYDDWHEALESYLYGLKEPIIGMDAEDRRRIAYHEAGHAVAQFYLVPRERVTKVTIIRRGDALGMMAPKPLKEYYTETAEEVEADIKVGLASRAAEKLFLKTRMSGVTADLAGATQRAVQYLAVWGMGDNLVSILPAQGQYNPIQHNQRDLNRLLRRLLAEVEVLLKDKAQGLDAIAQALLEREELSYREVAEILGRFDPAIKLDGRETIKPTDSEAVVAAALADEEHKRKQDGGQPGTEAAYQP
jgi:cell division protease FtsH